MENVAIRGAKTNSDNRTLARAGKYLTFTLNDECYGFDLLHVQEIIGVMAVTHVPKTPTYIRGVVNLRGKVIPVMELRRRFEMDTIADTERTCIIVLQTIQQGAPVITGVLVDSVAEVVDIAESQIEEAPTFGASVHTDFIHGVGKIAHKIVMLLDVDSVLSFEDDSIQYHRIETK